MVGQSRGGFHPDPSPQSSPSLAKCLSSSFYLRHQYYVSHFLQLYRSKITLRDHTVAMAVIAIIKADYSEYKALETFLGNTFLNGGVSVKVSSSFRAVY